MVGENLVLLFYVEGNKKLRVKSTDCGKNLLSGHKIEFHNFSARSNCHFLSLSLTS